MAGNTIKMKDLPVAESSRVTDLIGLDRNGQSVQLPNKQNELETEVANIGSKVGEIEDEIGGDKKSVYSYTGSGYGKEIGRQSVKTGVKYKISFDLQSPLTFPYYVYIKREDGSSILSNSIKEGNANFTYNYTPNADEVIVFSCGVNASAGDVMVTVAVTWTVTGGVVKEAPEDGNQYVRKNRQWVKNEPPIDAYSKTESDEKFATNTSVDNLDNKIESISEKIEELDIAIKSRYFDGGGNNWDSSAYRYITSDDGNLYYRGAKISRIRFYSDSVGSCQIVKNNLKKGVVAGQATILVDAIDVKVGLNSVEFDTPIVIEGEDEYIGINGVGFKLNYQSVYSNDNIQFIYIDSAGKAQISQKEIVVEIAFSKESAKLEEEIPRATSSLLQTKPFYYHWKPNGFVYGIPSQSIADNYLASQLGFNCVEINSHKTSDGKYIVTHGANGKFGAQFTAQYQDVLISSMTYNEIQANVKYNASKECYQTSVAGLETFLLSCSQLGLGVYLREFDVEFLELVRRYLTDDKIIMGGFPNVRKITGFRGLLTDYISVSPEACTVDYLQEQAQKKGGSPFHFVLNPDICRYMINNGILADVVGRLKSKGILVGGCYLDSAECAIMLANGAIGNAAQISQCNPFNCGNFGNWTSANINKDWETAEGFEWVGGTLRNTSTIDITIKTPSTGVLEFGQGSFNIIASGDIDVSVGDHVMSFVGCSESKPLAMGISLNQRNLRLTIKLKPNSFIRYVEYHVNKL